MTRINYSGTTVQCLNHLKAQMPHGDRERGEFYAPIAEACNVVSKTVGRWFKGAMCPKGEPLLRLRYYLAKRGYTVSEIESLAEPMRTLGQLIADHEISTEAALKYVGYSDEHGLYRTLVHGHPPLRERGEKMAELVAKYRPHGRGPYDLAREQRDSPPPTTLAVREKTNDRMVTIEVLAALMVAAQPLAALILSDTFTAEERQRLRDLAGKNGVYRLSTMLNRLCTESARASIAPFNG